MTLCHFSFSKDSFSVDSLPPSLVLSLDTKIERERKREEEEEKKEKRGKEERREEKKKMSLVYCTHVGGKWMVIIWKKKNELW